jgi:CHAT domain-containing protein
VLELTHQQRQLLGTQSLASLKPQDVIVVGNPTMPSIAPVIGEPPQQLAALPAAGAEANAIATFLNTEAILGARATKVAIVQQMPRARLIHLATHGLLDDIRQLGVPGAIALAPFGEDNGFLTAGEILELKLNAELVVLSACVTGLGKLTGDGVIGLSRCLMAAGVPRLIVSLWPVSDLSTAFLMINFYENLKNLSQLKPGDVAKAFNQSQKWLLNLTSEEAKQELEKLKPYIYRAFAGRSKRLAEARINRYLQDICDRAPHPFANPVYWSAFTTIGL